MQVDGCDQAVTIQLQHPQPKTNLGWCRTEGNAAKNLQNKLQLIDFATLLEFGGGVCGNGSALTDALIGGKCSEKVETCVLMHGGTKGSPRRCGLLLIISALGGSNRLIIQDGREDGAGRTVQTPIQPPRRLLQTEL